MNSKQKPPINSGLVQVPTMKLGGFCKPIMYFTEPSIDTLRDGKWDRYLDSLHPGEAEAKRKALLASSLL